MIYADSSFFVSLYLIDRHSKNAWGRVIPGHTVWLTPLNQVEVVHAIYAHVFWKKTTLAEAERATENFLRSRFNGGFRLADIPSESFSRSIDLARRYGPDLGVRTLDSLHVACALEFGAEKFWTFDERQARLAEAAGLDTNP